MATDNKYDRQLRLWGPHGQKKLSASRILMLGATATGSEVLKNLILPQIKKFTIVDNSTVSLQDCGQNFFLTDEEIGQLRSKVMMENLLELNPDDVDGEYIDIGVQDYINDQSQSWNDLYDLVIATDLPNSLALSISERCGGVIPFVLIRQYGLIGSIRIDMNELSVAEQKEYMVNQEDLRLNQPFEELHKFCNDTDAFPLYELAEKAADDKNAMFDQSHIPYVVIVLQSLQAWKQNCGGNLPKNFDEKKEFKEFIKMTCTDIKTQQNYQEAIDNAFKIYQDKLPYNVEDIFNNPKINDTTQTSSFWIMCSTLLRFHTTYNMLPVAGNIPDMTSTSEIYQKLNKIYHDKSQKDLEIFRGLLTQIIQERGLDFEQYVKENNIVDESATFCKNCKYLNVQNIRSLKDDLAEAKFPEEFTWELHDPENSCHKWLIVCRSFEEYRDIHGKYPGLLDHNEDSQQNSIDTTEQEFQEIKKRVDEYVAKITPDQKIDESFTREMIRYSDSKIHTVSAFLGGIASQEIIKILIQQYTIMNHTLIYDGIHGRTAVFKEE